MILFNTPNFYFAFNWNPKVKREKFAQNYRGDDFRLIDFWKFRILITELRRIEA